MTQHVHAPRIWLDEDALAALIQALQGADPYALSADHQALGHLVEILAVRLHLYDRKLDEAFTRGLVLGLRMAVTDPRPDYAAFLGYISALTARTSGVPLEHFQRHTRTQTEACADALSGFIRHRARLTKAEGVN